ncbi:MAG TPA: hypothetical protein VN065_06545, partial [Bradyrhizobium sp.]|nr:hypothetical protein [Bradyrhizobium sp.]
MLRSANSAFTHVFDALCLAAWCAADPGSILGCDWVPALRRTAEEALHRVRDTSRSYSVTTILPRCLL